MIRIESYLRKMIAHHKGAVEMSDVALRNGVSRTVTALEGLSQPENAAVLSN